SGRNDARPGARPRNRQDPAQHHHAGLDHDPAPDRSLADARSGSRPDEGAVPEGEGLSAGHRPHGAVARLARPPHGDGAEFRGRRGTDVNAVAIPRRIAHRFVHAFREVLPPTLFFLFSFNLIVFTTNLLVHDYWFRLSSFLVATTTALVVGKAVL